jgi:hypothetical protein
MATAGMGDALAGMIAALLAQGVLSSSINISVKFLKNAFITCQMKWLVSFPKETDDILFLVQRKKLLRIQTMTLHKQPHIVSL